jgi:hypothetical protein
MDGWRRWVRESMKQAKEMGFVLATYYDIEPWGWYDDEEPETEKAELEAVRGGFENGTALQNFGERHIP